MGDSELLNLENNNPLTMSRFSTLWQGVPIYFSQRDNYKMPDRTCNSSSNAMFLLSFRPWEIWDSDEDTYLEKLFKIGDTIYHENQTKCLLGYGLKTVWKTDKNETILRSNCDKKIPTVVNILHRGVKPNYRGGHVILIYDYDVNTKEYIYHDPYGDIKTDYARGSNGKSNRMKRDEFMARWQGGYRVCLS